MKNSNSRDYYDISNNFLKEISDLIVRPLAQCVNSCLAKGVFPNWLKISKVVPVFKRGVKTDPANFRPISLVPILGKIVEYVVFEQVSDYLEYYSFLTGFQFGFRSGSCTMDAIDVMVPYVTFCPPSRSGPMLGELFVT